ncbi:internal scaffolding protein [Enterobacteria phage FL76 Tallahassee/FL/2012]|uniref:Internal scaffolding protein B n=2 Tax=Gequatrovirus talmos TaxID=1910969 RepID=S5WK41_9VIRU|nr:internal scaffolding protein [Enterobacteria phage FL68 Tallahassee/FL/2012]AGS81876.1 internal scaffolding protein [Enterobacteria phage FL76 Tallahassee/FL/2012]
MEQFTQNQNQPAAQENLPHQNVSQLRNEAAHNESPLSGNSNPTDPSGLRRDPVQQHLEAERQERATIEAGKEICRRRFGGATCDDQSAKIHAQFDPSNRSVQPAEFYRFNDNEINKYGYF